MPDGYRRASGAGWGILKQPKGDYKMQVRHGDIFLEQIKSLPSEAREQKHNVLAEGEVTNHSHRLHSGIIYEDDKGNMFVRVPEQATLTHEEHNTVILPAGDYRVIRQREWNPYEQAVRQVAD
jgi:hypothetical protein